MDYLTLFLAGIDRITRLLEEFRQDRRTLFSQLIEPLAKDFAPVAENYILLFTRLGQDAAKAADENEFREAFRRFSEQRQEFERARRRIEILAETYAKRFGKDDAQEFFAKTYGFFYGDNEHDSLSRGLQERLERNIRRRIQTQRDLDAVPSQPGFDWWKSSPAPTFGPAGFDHLRSMQQDRLEGQLRENTRNRLSRELSENRAECVREAKELTQLLEQRWKALQEMFGDLRVKYTL